MEKTKVSFADINLKIDDVFDGIKGDMRQLFEAVTHYQKEIVILKNKISQLEEKIKQLKGDIR